MRTKKKRKLKTGPVVVLFLVVIFGILFYCIMDVKKSLKSGKNATEIKVVEEVKGYGYILNENDPKYYKALFKKLKSTLEKEDIDEEEYAKLESKMFLTDFFSLSNAINKNDIGGVQFVYSDYEESFTKEAKDTVYKYVENNIYGNRRQDLPTVTNVDVTDIKKESYKSKTISDDNAYYVNLKITYDKDLDYQTVATLTLVHHDDKLEIVNMK